MDLRKPIAINKTYKPVLIFKDGMELKECVFYSRSRTLSEGIHVMHCYAVSPHYEWHHP